jgi:hypothetical protein
VNNLFFQALILSKMAKITSIVILSFLLAIFLATFITAAEDITITTKGQVFTYEAGQEAELPCQVQDSNKDYPVIWKRNEDKILFIDEEAQEEFAGKLEVRKENSNNLLIISKIAPYDSANYTCMLNDEIKIMHKLVVIVPPKVTISLNSVLTRQGENVTVRCFGTGEPRPTIDWRRIGKEIPNSAAVLKDGTLQLPLINVSSSGTYECIGSNKYGKNATARIEITVNAREERDGNMKEEAIPTVETNKTYISVNEGDKVELVCRYDGNPSPEANWLINSFSLNKNEHQATESAKFENGYSYTTLTINNITAKSFGDYICRVSNKMGQVQTQIHVSAAPGPPALTVLENNEIQWDVESKQPIKEYKVLYRPANEDKFNSFQTFRASKDDQRGDIWHRTIKLDFLKPDTEYEIQVQARNGYGWGSNARNYVKVKTSSQEEKKTEKTNANSAMTAVASSLPLLIISGYILSGY